MGPHRKTAGRLEESWRFMSPIMRQRHEDMGEAKTMIESIRRKVKR